MIFFLIFPPGLKSKWPVLSLSGYIIHNKCMQNPHSTRCFQLIKGQTMGFSRVKQLIYDDVKSSPVQELTIQFEQYVQQHKESL